MVKHLYEWTLLSWFLTTDPLGDMTHYLVFRLIFSCFSSSELCKSCQGYVDGLNFISHGQGWILPFYIDCKIWHYTSQTSFTASLRVWGKHLWCSWKYCHTVASINGGALASVSSDARIQFLRDQFTCNKGSGVYIWCTLWHYFSFYCDLLSHNNWIKFVYNKRHASLEV